MPSLENAQAGEAHEGQSQQAGSNQRNGEALKALGAVSLADALTNGGEQNDGNGKAQAAGSAVDHADQEVVAILNVDQNDTQNSTVGGDQVKR